MKMAKNLKFGNIVLCEHVVRGEGGKSTLVNVYSGDIILSEAPVRMHMGVFIEYYPQKETDYDLFLEFMLDKKLFAKLTAQIENNSDGNVGSINLPLMELNILTSCMLEINAFAEGFNKKTIVQKSIMVRKI